MNAPRATMPPPVPPKTIWSADKTLRDEFAMAALTSLAPTWLPLLTDEQLARRLYKLADAMLEARNANR